MKRFFKFLMIIIIGLILFIWLYPTLHRYSSGYYNDRIDLIYFGFGEPFSIKDENNTFDFGPFRYKLTIKAYYTAEGIKQIARIEGLELEFDEDGWGAATIATYNKRRNLWIDKTIDPIIWTGNFDLEISNDSVAEINASLLNSGSDRKINLNVLSPVKLYEKTDDYAEYISEAEKEHCFTVAIQEQEITFCNHAEFFINSMASQIEKKYNKKLSQQRLNQLYSNYEN